MKNPIIGLNLDFEEKGGGYSLSPYHALREEYLTSLYENQAIPILLPPTSPHVETYLELIDGLILTGGNDYDLTLFGQPLNPALKLKIMHHRSEFDLALLRGALKKNIPVLGICAGMQAINLYFGGTIYQDIQTEREGSLNHLQSIAEVRTTPGHSVEVVPETLLSQITQGKTTISVNSFHHQAIKEVGEGLRASGIAPDGIIEAIEHPKYKFCLGVEWHPEFLLTPTDHQLFKRFINACR